MPRSPGAGRRRTRPQLGTRAPGRDRQVISSSGWSSTISASHSTRARRGRGRPSASGLPSSTRTDSRCAMKLGRFSRSRQNRYASAGGRLTVTRGLGEDHPLAGAAGPAGADGGDQVQRGDAGEQRRRWRRPAAGARRGRPESAAPISARSIASPATRVALQPAGARPPSSPAALTSSRAPTARMICPGRAGSRRPRSAGPAARVPRARPRRGRDWPPRGLIGRPVPRPVCSNWFSSASSAMSTSASLTSGFPGRLGRGRAALAATVTLCPRAPQ